MFLNFYIGVSILIALTDLYLAAVSGQKNQTTGRYLGRACINAAIVDISYLISILTDNYRCMSVMSSLYFVNIDFMLLNLVVFTAYFTKGRFTKWRQRTLWLGFLYAHFEVIVFFINPFREIVVHYVKRDTPIARYTYQMMPLYWMHLIFSYTMVAVVLFLLINKMFRIPWEYRAQYRYGILGIAVIVLVNAIFLFLPGESVYNLLDYSICGYSLTSFMLYWSCFKYATHGMLNSLKTNVFENIGQGIVLFDYNDQLILHNKRAEDLLGKIREKECMELEDFLNCYRLEIDREEDKSSSLQCYVKDGEKEHPLRCDVRSLKNEQNQHLGQLFVFSDAALETDLLTGFQEWESFKRFVKGQKDAFPTSTGIAMCDINGLSVINSSLGTQAGDQQIRKLAAAMRKYFPKQTYYVRGAEAALIALCSHCDEQELRSCIEKVKEDFSGKFQYAIAVLSDENSDVLKTIKEAADAMRTKKMLDLEAMHSEMLNSLIRALQECDSDTEHHVRRTQQIGAELGKRIGLTDIQQSRLSLLCLLHDIGKIGVPLEILNKPGKLSDEEWNILKSHTRKGYEIANSNHELKGIAEEILHHHERWDGNGYPDGLSRESIPLLSRVIAVVDAYDAMTNDRSYRSAMSVSAARAELKRCAGSQFDPFIVAEFLQLLKEKENTDDQSVESSTEKTENVQKEFQKFSAETEKTENDVHSVFYSRYRLDEEMRIVSVDDAFETITGYSREDVEQEKMLQSDLIPEEERTEYLCKVNAELGKHPVVYLEHKIRRKDGTDIYVFCYGRVYYDSAARAQRSELTVADINHTYSVKRLVDAEQNRAQVRLHYWEKTYRTDSLTGLMNHAAFRSDVEQSLLEGKSQILMLMMDVDHFKEYNDTYGHHNGDKYLILTAQTLEASLREDDRACRMGGDEFAAVLLLGRDVSEERIRERVRMIFDKINMTLRGTEGGSGISMGAALAEDDITFNQLYELADKALYQAKESGRGKYVIYDKMM